MPRVAVHWTQRCHSSHPKTTTSSKAYWSRREWRHSDHVIFLERAQATQDAIGLFDVWRLLSVNLVLHTMKDIQNAETCAKLRTFRDVKSCVLLWRHFGTSFASRVHTHACAFDSAVKSHRDSADFPLKSWSFLRKKKEKKERNQICFR